MQFIVLHQFLLLQNSIGKILLNTNPRYYIRKDAENAMRYVNGTRLDDRIIRTDWDAGFKEGRQYGRGKSGGQVRSYCLVTTRRKIQQTCVVLCLFSCIKLSREHAFGKNKGNQKDKKVEPLKACIKQKRIK